MLNVLFEIGCEEIPARFMPGLLEDLKKKAEEKLTRERLSFAQVKTLGTARRLVLWVENIAAKQTNLTEELKGPPAEIAFDASGKPTQAALGFARTQGVAPAKLFVRTVGPKNYVFARRVRRGKPAAVVLQALLPEIISSLYLPVSMRWGSNDFKFIRPIHALFAQCGTKVIKLKMAGIESAKRKPKQAAGIIDQDKRKALIRQLAAAAGKKAGGEALIDADLLAEVTFLVENPIVYVGKFDPEFLGIPQEVLITSMKKNQKYFPVRDRAGNLLPKFIVVTDGCKNPKVVKGNEKVLSARLSDARFFFEEDKKQPLKMRVSDLEKVAFFEKLGTLCHKVERMMRLSEWLGKRLGISELGIKLSRRIAELSKADLTTKMVFEFPELQGIMGREYARLSGEDGVVAEGIAEHYLPRFADDKLPVSKEGTIVALADRLDSLVGAFSAGAVPTGSEDPYGLRRAVQGIIRLIIEKRLDLLLDESLAHAYKLYEPVFLGYLFGKGETGYQDFPKIKTGILDFIAGRLRPLLLDKGIRYDVADAVLSGFNDILDVWDKAEAINNLLNEPWLPGVVASADRLGRIAGKAPREQVLEHDLEEPEEKALYELYLKVNWEVNERIKKEQWAEAARELAKLTAPIELFFDKVLVMHENERLKLNRLALLKSLQNTYLAVADFPKIVV